MPQHGRYWLLLLALFGSVSWAQRLTLATTSSVENSGVLERLLEPFEASTGYFVDVLVVGSGAALELAARGDVDVVIAHAPEAELAAYARGDVVERRYLMHNDFVILGAADDPAQVATAADALAALARIAAHEALFVSRGDDSGTHQRERSLWAAVGIEPAWPAYLDVGQGMEAALIIANEQEAYILSDRATFAVLQARAVLDLHILYEGDPRLTNPYHVMMANPQRHPIAYEQEARELLDYLLSDVAHTILMDFRAAGVLLFDPRPWP